MLDRFEVLDSLISAGYGSTDQRFIPAEVLEAAEQGLPIPVKGEDRDKSLVGNPFSDHTPPTVALRRLSRDAERKRATYEARKQAIAAARAGTSASQGESENYAECSV